MNEDVGRLIDSMLSRRPADRPDSMLQIAEQLASTASDHQLADLLQPFTSSADQQTSTDAGTVEGDSSRTSQTTN